MSDLTKRQQEILQFIKKEVKEKGYPPSVREIGEAVGLASSSTVHGHLSKLETKGFIRRDPTKPRAIEIMGDQSYSEDNSQKIPLIGKVTAGLPITAIENIEEYITYPLSHNPSENATLFALEIMGESMIEAGIFDGDYVIVKQQSTALNGEIVVALTDDNEATVKRFFKEKNVFRLQPENSSMEPIFLDNVQVLGKVIGLYRTIY